MDVADENDPPAVNVPLGVCEGMTFADFDIFQSQLVKTAKEHFIILHKPLSRTMEAARKKGLKKNHNPALKYYSAQWACVHGGRKYNSRGQGIRSAKTLLRLCPAHVSVVACNSRKGYKVSSVNNNHNHKIAKQLFQYYPHNRQLPDDIKKDVKKLLHMKANKDLVKEDLAERLDHHVTLKDLSNLRQYCNAHANNNIKDTCSKIQSKFGADCNLLIDANNIFRGLMFCTQSMTESMNAYPEFICIDATYKLLNIKAPVYVILNEDGNGESGIVAIGVLMSEDFETLEWFFETFKSLNPSSWEKIQNIMTDKDLTERDVLIKCFPCSQLHICIFHVLKIFQRECTIDNLKITSSQRNLLLELLQNLVYAKSNGQFDEIVHKLTSNFPDRVIKYIQDNWFGIRDQWCPYLGNKINNFLNKTNNRLECINSKLKSVIDKFSKLEKFLDNLFVVINSMEREKNFRTANIINKTTADRNAVYGPTDFQYKYLKLLTPYSFDKLEKQFMFGSVCFILNQDGEFQVMNTSYVTTCCTCTCYFSTSMGLPCKHIFALRCICNENMFDSGLVLDRWKMTYFLDHCNLLQNPVSETPSMENSENQQVHMSIIPNTNGTDRIISQQEKYKRTFVKCKLIAALASEACGDDYVHVNQILDVIIDKLQKNNYEFEISTNDVSPQDSLSVMEITSAGQFTNQGIQPLQIEKHKKSVETNECELEDLIMIVDPDGSASGERDSEDGHNIEGVGAFESQSENNVVNIKYTDGYANFQSDVEMEHFIGDVANIEKLIIIENNTNNLPVTTINGENTLDTKESANSVANLNGSEIVTLRGNSLNENNEGVGTDNNNVSSKMISRETVSLSPDLLTGENLDLNDIKVHVGKRKGRPRGGDLTVIGLKRKKFRKGLVKFKDKKRNDKIQTMLQWVLKDANIVTSRQIQLTDLRPLQELDSRILEVNTAILKKFFSNGSWSSFQMYKKLKSKTAIWQCSICSQIVSKTDPSVNCDYCLNWVHVACTKKDMSPLQCFMCEICSTLSI